MVNHTNEDPVDGAASVAPSTAKGALDAPVDRAEDQVPLSIAAIVDQVVANLAERGCLEGEDLPPILDVGRVGDFAYHLLAGVIDVHLGLSPEGIRKLECAWNKATRASFVEPILLPLMGIIRDRIEKRRAMGQNFHDVTDDVSLFVELDGYLLLGDINGYSQISTLAEAAQKAGVSRDFYEGLKRVGGQLAEQVQGDAALPVISGDLRHALAALRAYQDLKIDITDPALLGLTRLENGEVFFPDTDKTGHARATFSLGLHKGKVRLNMRTGKGNSRGLIRAHGKDYNEVTRLQTAAKPGQSLLHKDLIPAARALGTTVTDEGVIESLPEGLEGHMRPSGHPDFPREDLVFAVKVIEALARLFPHLGSNEAFLEEADVELTSRLNCTYLVAKFVDPSTGRPVSEMDSFWDQLAAEGTGSRAVEYFKVVGDAVHCTAKIGRPEQWRDALLSFFQQMHGIARAHGLEVHISTSYEDALEILPVPNSAFVDYTGNAIVAAYRGASIKRPGSWVSLDRSFLAYAGLMTNEMETFVAKGVPYQHVVWNIQEDGALIPHEARLVGVQHIEASLRSFLSVEDPRTVFQLSPPPGYEGSGSGVSALQRRAVTLAIDEGHFDRSRVLFVHGSASDPRALLASILGCEFEGLMTALGGMSEPLLIVKEGPTSFEQQSILDWLARQAKVAGVPLKLIVDDTVDVSDEFYTDMVAEKQFLRELTVEEAMTMIFEARQDLDPATDSRILKQLILQWKDRAKGRWLVPRFVLNDLAVQLVKEGQGVSLRQGDARKDWAGELARALEAKKIGERGRCIVGILSILGEPVTLDELHSVYSSSFGALDQSALKDELLRLSSSTGEAFVKEESGRYVLGVTWDRRLGMKLARKQETQIRRWAINQYSGYSVSPETHGIAMQEFEHRTRVREFCTEARSFDLVADLVEFYGKDQKNIVAAMAVLRTYLKAMERFGQAFNPCVENKRLLTRMAWVVMQVGTEQEKQLIATTIGNSLDHPDKAQLSVSEKAEFLWRVGYTHRYHLPLSEGAPVLGEHEPLLQALLGLRGHLDCAQPKDRSNVQFAINKAIESLARAAALKPGWEMAQAGCGAESVVAYGFETAYTYQMSFASGRLKFILGKMTTAPDGFLATLRSQVDAFDLQSHEVLSKTVPQSEGDSVSAEVMVNALRLKAGMRRNLYGDGDEVLHQLFKEALSGYEELEYPEDAQRYTTQNGAINSRIFRVHAWMASAESTDMATVERIGKELDDILAELKHLSETLASMAQHSCLSYTLFHLRNTYELRYWYAKRNFPDSRGRRLAEAKAYREVDHEMERFYAAIGFPYQRDDAFYDELFSDEDTEEIER